MTVVDWMSARRSGPYRPIIPAWSATVGQMEAHEGTEVKAVCGSCHRSWPLDPKFIAKQKGPFYTLWGRKVKCRCGKAASVLARHSDNSKFDLLDTEEGLENSDVKRLHGRCGWCGGPKD